MQDILWVYEKNKEDEEEKRNWKKEAEIVKEEEEEEIEKNEEEGEGGWGKVEEKEPQHTFSVVTKTFCMPKGSSGICRGISFVFYEGKSQHLDVLLSDLQVEPQFPSLRFY